MDSPRFQVADASHIAVLLPLVQAYHEFEQIVLSEQQRRDALWPLLAPNFPVGRVWLIFISGLVDLHLWESSGVRCPMLWLQY